MTVLALDPGPVRSALVFHVDGVAQPKGSAKAFVVKDRAVVTNDNPKTRPWAALVRDAAQQAAGATIACPRGVPVVLGLSFVLPRPVSLPKRVQAHTKKPDVDKLTRAVLDALTGVVWQDDSQVVDVSATKRYAVGDERAHVSIGVTWQDGVGA